MVSVLSLRRFRMQRKHAHQRFAVLRARQPCIEVCITPVYLEPLKMLPWSGIHTRSTINILFILSWSLKYLAVIATELKKQKPLWNKEEQRSKKENHPGKPL